MRAPKRTADERGIRSEIVLKRDRTYEARPKLGLLNPGPCNHHDSLAQLRRPRLPRFHPMPDSMGLMRKSHSAVFVSFVPAMPAGAGGETAGAGLRLARGNGGYAVPKLIQRGALQVETPLLDR